MKYPILLNKRKVIVAAEIRGIKKDRQYSFLLDTGATKTLMNESIAMALGFDLKRLPTERLMTAGGGKNSKVLKLPKFTLFGKSKVNFEVNIVEFSPQFTIFADGLIGMDFLLLFENVNFDFKKNTIEVC